MVDRNLSLMARGKPILARQHPANFGEHYGQRIDVERSDRHRQLAQRSGISGFAPRGKKALLRSLLRRFFEPAAYKTGMAEPDFFWCPLLGIYTGMRISEATAIRCEDVRQADNGLHFVFVPKSKTSAGIRSVPICRALVELGFLDFVALQRTAGHDRLFPDRLLINHSYSKKLSERMKDYLVERGIKRDGDHKSFHSFRVNVITQLANNGVNTAMSMKIVGHKSRDGDDVHMGYVRDLPAMKEAVDALAWPIEIAELAESHQRVGKPVATRQAEQRTRFEGAVRIERDASDPGKQHLLKLAARLRASDEIRALVRSLIAVEGLDQWRLWATRVADEWIPGYSPRGRSRARRHTAWKIAEDPYPDARLIPRMTE